MKLSTRARIGLLPAGHHYYWEQFPRLKQMGLRMHSRLFAQEAVDMVLVFPFGYTPSMDMSRHQR